jgi:hypothetical protein
MTPERPIDSTGFFGIFGQTGMEWLSGRVRRRGPGTGACLEGPWAVIFADTAMPSACPGGLLLMLVDQPCKYRSTVDRVGYSYGAGIFFGCRPDSSCSSLAWLSTVAAPQLGCRAPAAASVASGAGSSVASPSPGATARSWPGGDDPMQSTNGGQEPDQCRNHRPVRPRQSRSAHPAV